MANFFEQQAQARSITTRLVGLYILAVVCICLTVGTVISFVIGLDRKGPPVDPSTPFFARDFTGEMVGILATLLIIAIGTWKRSRELSGGGPQVASLLGGIEVSPSTKDPLERRLLNVVEEMAIASGIPVPRVYLLKQEEGINAFAAGMSPGDAVIGVTKGTLEQLTRDELQGVVAHEFSHIFNGDMRLNLRLMGVLGGILALTTVGKIILDSTPRRRSSGSKKGSGNGFIFLGIALIVVGYVGVFFARLIKAAISRQREYLADSSAVQYTRNPNGIGGALMKIGGLSTQSTVTSPYAEEASHMFFGTVKSFSNLFATHPELDDRVNRISPMLLKGGWKPTYDTELTGAGYTKAAGFSSKSSSAPEFDLPQDYDARLAREPSIASAISPASPSPRSQSEAAAQRANVIMQTVGMPTLDDLAQARNKIDNIPQVVRDQLNTTVGATAGVLALLLQSESGSSAQTAFVRDSFDTQTLEYAQVMYREMGESLYNERLLILELAIPALRHLDEEEQRKLLLCCRDLVHADGRYDLFEYVALTILDHQFFASKRRNRPRPRLTGPKTTNDVSTVLSAIAHSGTTDQTKAKAAFDAGVDAIRAKHPYPLTFRGADECRLQAIADAVDRLSYLEPGSQKMVVDACIRTVIHDRVINRDESELLKAICTILEAPLPTTSV